MPRSSSRTKSFDGGEDGGRCDSLLSYTRNTPVIALSGERDLSVVKAAMIRISQRLRGLACAVNS